MTEAQATGGDTECLSPEAAGQRETCDARQGASPPLIEFRRSGHGGTKAREMDKGGPQSTLWPQGAMRPGSPHRLARAAAEARLGLLARARSSPARPTGDTTPADPSGDMKMVPSPASDWPGGRRRGLRSLVPRARARKPHCELGTEQAPW